MTSSNLKTFPCPESFWKALTPLSLKRPILHLPNSLTNITIPPLCRRASLWCQLWTYCEPNCDCFLNEYDLLTCRFVSPTLVTTIVLNLAKLIAFINLFISDLINELLFCILKLVSAIFYQILIFAPNDSPSKTMKNVFYFI